MIESIIFIIIDTSHLGIMFSQPNNKDVRAVQKWVNGNGGIIVYSTDGDFSADVHGNARMRLRN